MTQVQRPHISWLDVPQPKIKVSAAEDLGQTITPLYGVDLKQMHDWNEEF